MLDVRLPWRDSFALRTVMQIALGIILFGVFFYVLIYVFSEKVIGTSLFPKDYLERDFVVLMTAVTIVNSLHFSMYWSKLAMRRQVQSFYYKEVLKRVDTELRQLKGAYESLHMNHHSMLEESALGLELSQELRIPIKAIAADRHIAAVEIVCFFRPKDKSDRHVYIKLWDGTQHILEDKDSLQAIESLFSRLFVRLTRDYLVNTYSIAKIEREGAKHHRVYFVVDHMPQIIITNDTLRKMEENVGIDYTD